MFHEVVEPLLWRCVHFPRQFLRVRELLNSGVEYRNPEKVLGGWLPLEAYDDNEMDTKLAG